MKSIRLVLMCFLLVPLLSVAHAEQLRYAAYTPSGHKVEKVAIRPHLEQIEKETGGSLKFRFFAAGELLPAKSIMSGVQGGVAHAGQVISLVVASELPHYHLVNAAMVHVADPLVANGAAQEFLFLNCPECRKDFADRGLIHLGDYATSPYFNIFCTSDVESLEDLKGLRIRGLSESARWLATLGATPVSMSSPEMVEALQGSGQVSCGIGPISWIESYGLTDALRSVLVIKRGAYPAINYMTMNRSSWDSLERQQKQAIINGLPDALARATTLGYDQYDAEVRERAEEAGISFVDVPEESLRAPYARFLKDEAEIIRNRFQEYGVAEPQQQIDQYLRLVEKWRSVVADMEDRSPESYAAALRSHVFDKVDVDGL